MAKKVVKKKSIVQKLVESVSSKPEHKDKIQKDFFKHPKFNKFTSGEK